MLGASMKKRPAIPRLDGGPQTILLVENVERSVAFYQDDLRLEKKDGDTSRYVEFDTGDGGVLLILQREGSIAPMAMGAAATTPNTLTFNVEDDGYEAWKKWLVKRNIPIERETRWIHGGRSLFVRDPDARRIEFKTPPVVRPPSRPPMAVERKNED
jgi:catechol 2,3-dioxygenase-like lactoylglutathione lyase family enzyme